MSAMSDEEWDAARRYMLSGFPGLLTWFRRLPPEIADGTRKQWRRVLGRCDVQDVMQAIDAMVDGSVERPRCYEDYPAAIAKRAGVIAGNRDRGRTRRRIDGMPTVCCQQCDDTGWVFCWQPSALRELLVARRAGRPPLAERLIGGAVRCPCKAGKVREDRQQVLFDERRDLPLRPIAEGGVFAPPDPTDAEQIARAYEWLDRRAERRPNYEHEFAEFSG